MSLDRLTRLIPPPPAPAYAFGGPWERLEAQLGLALPQDYKDLVRLYGLGRFMGFLWVYVPCCDSPWVRFETAIVQARQSVLAHDERPYPVWPAAGGLLAFGGTDNGEELFWRTGGPPETWTVVVWGPRGTGYEQLDCGLADFLVGVATRGIVPTDFPDDLEEDDWEFAPAVG